MVSRTASRTSPFVAVLMLSRASQAASMMRFRSSDIQAAPLSRASRRKGASVSVR